MIIWTRKFMILVIIGQTKNIFPKWTEAAEGERPSAEALLDYVSGGPRSIEISGAAGGRGRGGLNSASSSNWNRHTTNECVQSLHLMNTNDIGLNLSLRSSRYSRDDTLMWSRNRSDDTYAMANQQNQLARWKLVARGAFGAYKWTQG